MSKPHVPLSGYCGMNAFKEAHREVKDEAAQTSLKTPVMCHHVADVEVAVGSSSLHKRTCRTHTRRGAAASRGQTGARTNCVVLGSWPLPVAVLGGGLGTRLRPLTTSVPKPLVEVNGRPMIDRVIDSFRACGCDDFLVTTGYRADQLRRHFEAGREGMRLRFVDNGNLDGTAIWWRTLKDAMEGPFVLTCCDVLVDADFPAIAREHAVRGDAMTLVAYRRTRVIPGGAVQVGADRAFEGFSSRRADDEIVYSGVAVVEPAVFSLEGGGDNPLTLRNLLGSCRAAGWNVGVHVVEESAYHDMGSITALVRTSRALREADGDRSGLRAR